MKKKRNKDRKKLLLELFKNKKFLFSLLIIPFYIILVGVISSIIPELKPFLLVPIKFALIPFLLINFFENLGLTAVYIITFIFYELIIFGLLAGYNFINRRKRKLFLIILSIILFLLLFLLLSIVFIGGLA